MSTAPGWESTSFLSGFYGSGYLRITVATTTPAQGVLGHSFYVTQPGDYAVAVRTRRQIDEEVESDQRNDVFVRLDGSAWAKATHHSPFGLWGFIDKRRQVELDHETPFVALMWDLEMGRHTFLISRRSEEVLIDRILIFRTDAAPTDLTGVRSDRPNASIPESSRKP